MNERIRRLLIFVIIVGAGTLLILFDLPLLLILPLIMAIGFVLLILLGAIPVAELKTLGSSLFRKGRQKPAPDAAAKKPDAKDTAQSTKKKGFSFNLGSLFKKKGAKKEPVSPAAAQQKGAGTPAAKKRPLFGLGSLFQRKPESPAQKTGGAEKPRPAPGTVRQKGLSLHITSLVSSVKAMGSILTAKRKTDPDKIKKIDTMLDLAVSEKIDKSTPLTGTLAQDTAIPTAGAGTGGAGSSGIPPMGTPAEEDPFLSLSNDELDSGLLDDLDVDEDTGPATPAAPGEAPTFSVHIPDESTGIPLGEADMPLPPQDLSSSAEDILKANEPELADLPALEGIESVDENLGELDNLSLDSVELDDETDEEAPGSPPAASAPAPAAAASPAPDWVDTKVAGATSGPAVTTAGSKSGSDQSEMAAFAAASGGDDDMLSSLAADIKTVAKKQDLSLLRDLKDFRAPGTTIETELSDLYSSLNAATERQRKFKPAPAKKQKAK